MRNPERERFDKAIENLVRMRSLVEQLNGADDARYGLSTEEKNTMIGITDHAIKRTKTVLRQYDKDAKPANQPE